MFGSVRPTAAEVRASRPGDELVDPAAVTMDRAFTVDAAPRDVWPWLVQLGKGRAGWYLSRRAERALPRSRRASRTVDERWQHLAVGDVIPDYGGRNETFTVAAIDAPHALVYRSRRGHTDVSWSISLQQQGGYTRVHLRLRLGPVKHVRLAESVGGAFDAATIAAMAAGLRERVRALPG